MNYLLYGLSWSLPFLSPDLPETKELPAITVAFGVLDEKDINWTHTGVCYKATRGAYLLCVPGVAKYLATNGDTIIIEAEANIPQEDIVIFLYNLVAGAILLQRGILPLQASVVAKKGKASVLLGGSGMGKSIVAAGLMQQGFDFVTDTICAVHPGDEPIIKAGYPYLMLWHGEMKMLGYEPNQCKKARRHLEKYCLPVPDERFCTEAIIENLYLFENSNESGLYVTPIIGQAKFTAILISVYHNPLINAFGVQKELYRSIITLINKSSIEKVRSSMRLDKTHDFLNSFSKQF